MRLAVFSDIHSNEFALSACLAYADHVGVDGYVFLGDHLTDCPYPQRTLHLLRQAGDRLPTWMVRGDREELLLKHHDRAEKNWKISSETGSLLYTYQNLTEEDFRFLKRMPTSQVIKLPGCPHLCIAHAASNNTGARLYPGSETLESVMRACPQRTLLSGHSHFQFRYESGGRQFVNPGSVGMPIHSQPKAQFALMTCSNGRWSTRLMNVDYDKEAEIRQFEESGLSDMARMGALATVKTIREGGSWTLELRQQARKNADSETAVPESCWERAAAQLGLTT